MTRTTRLLATSLVPWLSTLGLAACTASSPSSDGLGAGGSIVAAAGTLGSGGAGTLPAGVGMGGMGSVATAGSGPATGGVVGTGGGSGAPVSIAGNSGGVMGGSSGMTAVAGGAAGALGGSPAGSAGADGTTTAAGSGGDGGASGVTVDGVNVQLNKTRQNIQGFGINTALSPGGSLPWDDLFTTDGPNAVGMSILRVGMQSNGSLTGYGISEAKARGAKVIGSTWSPPANCKSNNSTQNGGHLKPECRDSWAETIANFADQQGLYAMSIANESDFASCPGVAVCTVAYDTTVYTAAEMVEWVKVAGAKIKEVNPEIKVIAPEASEWVHAWSNLSGTGSEVASHPHSSDPLDCGCYGNVITPEAEADCAQTCKDGNGYDYGHWLWADQDAWASFDILGVHEYDSQIGFAWPADVNGGVRDKEVWQTEMSGVKHWPEQGPSTDIDNGVAVAGWIHSALTVGEASAWLYWWYEAYYENDNEGLAITQNSGTIAKRYFTYGNYSKFVRPGYFAVEVAGNDNADVLLSAYTGDAGQVVVVAINKGDAAAEFPITITGGTAPASMTPHVTSASDNLVAGNAVPVAGGVFTASLDPKTVTSFVGE